MTNRATWRYRSVRPGVRCCRSSCSFKVITAGERHDLVCGHSGVCSPAHVGNELLTAAWSLLVSRGTDVNGLAIIVELDLGVGHQSGLFADGDRDRHLALGGDARGSPLFQGKILTSISKKFL